MDISRQWFLYLTHFGEVQQKHTRNGPFNKSLFLHKAPSVKSTPPSPPLFHQENATAKNHFSNYNDTIHLQLLTHWGPGI
jgi:hypothetical protein